MATTAMTVQGTYGRARLLQDGMELPDDLAEHEWREIGRWLRDVDRSAQWWINEPGECQRVDSELGKRTLGACARLVVENVHRPIAYLEKAA
jgi:hypothetical protein